MKNLRTFIFLFLALALAVSLFCLASCGADPDVKIELIFMDRGSRAGSMTGYNTGNFGTVASSVKIQYDPPSATGLTVGTARTE